MTIDSLSSPTVTSAGSSVLPLFVWVVAAGAAVGAAVQRAGEIARLRTDLDELQKSRTQTASVPSPAPGRRSTGPMLGALYQDRPGLLDRLGASGATLTTVAAALLALIGGTMIWRDASHQLRAAGVPHADLARVQQAQDSLSILVSQLRDSLRLVATTATSVGTPHTPAASPAAPAKAARAGTLAARPKPAATIPSVLPPAPLIPSALGAGLAGAQPPDSARTAKP